MDGGSWHCTGDKDQDHPQGKEMQKSKRTVWGGLTNSCEKKRSKKQRRKGKICPFECRVPEYSKERWESLPQWSLQKIEENKRMGKVSDLLKKIRDTKGIFLAKMGSIKDRDGMDLTEAEDIKKSWQEYTKNCTEKIFMTQIIMMVWLLT